MRRAAPFLLTFVAVGALALADGGYDPPAWGWAAVGLAWAAAVGVAAGGGLALSRLELVALAALAAFAGWAALSAAWTASVPLTVLDAQRLLVLPLGLAAFLALRDGLGPVQGVAAAAALVSTWNLVTRVGAGDDLGERAQPLGYGNAVAIVAGIGLLLALGLARERPAWLAACLPTAAALLLSDSRGAAVAVGSGAVVVAALRSRLRLAFPLAVAGGAAALAASALLWSDERSAYWEVAAEAAAERPLLGSGAGTWVRDWLASRDVALPARDAHSLVLETLAELGPLGLALVLAALLAPLVAASRAREQRFVPEAAGAYAAFVLHAGVDWDLELPAVALAGLACGAFLLTSERAARAAVQPRQALLALALAAVVGAAGLLGNTFVAAAAGALRAGDGERAESRAGTATTLAPWSAEAWRLRGEAQRLLGDREAAVASFREGLRRDAGDVELWLALARVEVGEERRRALERARRLNPLGLSP